MKLKELLKLRKTEEIIDLGYGATRKAFYIKNHSKDIIKTGRTGGRKAGLPKFYKQQFIDLVIEYMEGEEQEIALKNINKAVYMDSTCISRETDLKTLVNLSIVTERLISLIISYRGDDQKYNFSRCLEICEVRNKVYGRYENGNHKKRKEPTILTNKRYDMFHIKDRKGNVIAYVDDLHLGNYADKNPIILDYAMTIFKAG